MSALQSPNGGFATLDGKLIERPGYRQAQILGRTPPETAFPSLNARNPPQC
jgi:hypothetical protein